MTQQQTQGAAAKAAGTSATEKLVNFDEYYDRTRDLRAKEMSVGEKLFDAFVNTPYNMMLFVRRGVSEAWQELVKGKTDDKPAVFIDRLNGGTYLNRAAVDADNAYAQGHGLSAKFQAKAARIATQAFDECRDFSVLARTGQLRPLRPA